MLELTFDQTLSLALLKIIFMIGSLFYFIYSFVVVRQVAVMKKTLITGFSDTVTLLALINLILSVVMLFGFLIFL